jgi:hypothetical protein
MRRGRWMCVYVCDAVVKDTDDLASRVPGAAAAATSTFFHPGGKSGADGPCLGEDLIVSRPVECPWTRAQGIQFLCLGVAQRTVHPPLGEVCPIRSGASPRERLAQSRGDDGWKS